MSISAGTARLFQRTALPLLLALATVAGPAGAAARDWVLDPVHTRVLLGIDHAGFSQALGTVSGSRGRLVFDPDDWSSARVEVEIPLEALDFGDAQWNRATLARNLLDAQTYPIARFRSLRVEPLDANRAIVHGELALRGVTREVALEVTVNAVKRHPLPPFRRTAGFSATATLSRADFGINAWRSLIGDTVSIRIEAEATLTHDDATTTATPSPEPSP